MPLYRAVDGSAKQNLLNSFMKSDLNIMHRERRRIHVIQHNTNDTKTAEKPGYIPSSLAFSTDVNNCKDRYQATMNNMGMEHGRMRKEPDNQTSGKAMGKVASKTAHATSTFRRGNKDPYDSDSDPAYQFSYFRAASAVEYCDPLLSPGTIPCFQDIFGPQPTFTWKGGEDIPISETVSNDGACNNEFVIYYEGTTDAAQPVPPSPGMDHDPSAALESSTAVTALLSQELMDEDTSRVTCAAPQDCVEQGLHLLPEEDTAKPVV